MKHLFYAVMVFSIFQAHAADWEESPEVAELFKNADVNGAFVLFDATSRRIVGHNQTRANTRFVPASTFKIPHTLIGLTVGAVKSVDEVLPYGGRPQPLKTWEKDMGLRDAITLSNVPIYQELARRIGLERMRKNVSTLDFGNEEVGAIVDNFWLKGPLKISAVEQARFLSRLAQNDLPCPKSHQQSVQEIILMEKGENWALHAKTGWVNAPDQGVGWWVGWARKGDRVYAFALNMDMHQASDANKRIELGKASLKALGVM